MNLFKDPCILIILHICIDQTVSVEVHVVWKLERNFIFTLFPTSRIINNCSQRYKHWPLMNRYMLAHAKHGKIMLRGPESCLLRNLALIKIKQNLGKNTVVGFWKYPGTCSRKLDLGWPRFRFEIWDETRNPGYELVLLITRLS